MAAFRGTVNGFNHPPPDMLGIFVHLTNQQYTAICTAHKRLKDVATRCVLRAGNESICICDPWELTAHFLISQLDLGRERSGEGKEKDNEGGEKRKGRKWSGVEGRGRSNLPQQKFWLRPWFCDEKMGSGT